jgi:monoterpene epsilon-lactone hydrolase
VPTAGSIALPTDIDSMLVALEARDIARRIGKAAGPALHWADMLAARGENMLTKWWLARLLRRIGDIPDQETALAWLDQLRARTAGGTWSVLPEGGGVLAMMEGGMPSGASGKPGAIVDRAAAADGDERPLLFYIAGGGFILPPTPRQRAIAEDLAEAFGASAVMGRHRLAPEHPYPLPVEDLCGHFLSIVADGQPASRIIVAGDAAGATLLMSMLLALRDRENPMPAGALLFSPWTDLAMRGWSYVTKGISSDSPFRMETAAFAARLYLGDTLPTEPNASPAYADLAGLPPIAVHCSRYDMHFDDAVRLAEQADAAGVPVRMNYWESPRHHLERFRSPDARESIEIAASIARDWLHRAETR